MIEELIMGFASGTIIGIAGHHLYLKYRNRSVSELIDNLFIAKYNQRLHDYIRKNEKVQEELGEDLCGALLINDEDVIDENNCVGDAADEVTEIPIPKKKKKAKKKVKPKEELGRPLEEEVKPEEPKKEEEPKKAVPIDEPNESKDEIDEMMDAINGKLKK